MPDLANIRRGISRVHLVVSVGAYALWLPFAYLYWLNVTGSPAALPFALGLLIGLIVLRLVDMFTGDLWTAQVFAAWVRNLPAPPIRQRRYGYLRMPGHGWFRHEIQWGILEVCDEGVAIRSAFPIFHRHSGLFIPWKDIVGIDLSQMLLLPGLKLRMPRDLTIGFFPYALGRNTLQEALLQAIHTGPGATDGAIAQPEDLGQDPAAQ